MNGRRAKALRKRALALHPEGSVLNEIVNKTKTFELEGKTHTVAVGHQLVYSGYRRAYQDLKKEIKHGKTNQTRVSRVSRG